VGSHAGRQWEPRGMQRMEGPRVNVGRPGEAADPCTDSGWYEGWWRVWGMCDFTAFFHFRKSAIIRDRFCHGYWLQNLLG
jgi:hypothetical protein